MIIVDTYSRFLSVVEIGAITASNTIAALSKAFETWGLPMIIQSDNGPPFFSSEFIEHWERKGVRVRKSIPLSAQSNGAVERQNQGILKALAGSKEDSTNWRSALDRYVHVHNTIKPHSRLGITPFELLVGWKYRGSFPALWESKSIKELDRNDVRERDSLTKLISKSYADRCRGAKPSTIKAGDVVVMAIPRPNKTDPLFSRERYTVLMREGAKVVIRSGRGVQYVRNVQDIKRVPEKDYDANENDLDSNDVTEDEAVVDDAAEKDVEDRPVVFTDTEFEITNNDAGASRNYRPYSNVVNAQEAPSTAQKTHVTSTRPKRIIRKPEKFKDMFVYHVSNGSHLD